MSFMSTAPQIGFSMTVSASELRKVREAAPRSRMSSPRLLTVILTLLPDSEGKRGGLPPGSEAWDTGSELEWRNWQTHGTQNPAPFTGHESSTLSSSTYLSPGRTLIPFFKANRESS